MLKNSQSLNLPEFLKFCKVFALPLTGKKCLAIFKNVADPTISTENANRRYKSLPKSEGIKPHFTLDYNGFKLALKEAYTFIYQQKLD